MAQGFCAFHLLSEAESQLHAIAQAQPLCCCQERLLADASGHLLIHLLQQLGQ